MFSSCWTVRTDAFRLPSGQVGSPRPRGRQTTARRSRTVEINAGSSVRLASLKAAKNARTTPSGVDGSADGDAVADDVGTVVGVGVGVSRPTSRTPPATTSSTARLAARTNSGRRRSGIRFISGPRRRRAIDGERHDGIDPREAEQRYPGGCRDLDAHRRDRVRGTRDRIDPWLVRDDDLRGRRDLGRRGGEDVAGGGKVQGEVLPGQPLRLSNLKPWRLARRERLPDRGPGSRSVPPCRAVPGSGFAAPRSSQPRGREPASA